MSEKNPFLQNTYQWHDFEMKNAPENSGGMVWVHHPFFWDKAINRPKFFPKKMAHLYAIMFILQGKAEFVYVEDRDEYLRKKFGVKSLTEPKKTDSL